MSSNDRTGEIGSSIHERGGRPSEPEKELYGLIEETMTAAARALRRRRAGVDLSAPLNCPLCGGRLWNEQVLVTSSVDPDWDEAYRYACERCDFHDFVRGLSGAENGITSGEYLWGNGRRGDPFSDDAVSQRFARDRESRSVAAPLKEIERCADEHDLDYTMVWEAAQAVGIIQHMEVITDVELEHIRAGIARAAKEREK